MNIVKPVNECVLENVANVFVDLIVKQGLILFKCLQM